MHHLTGTVKIRNQEKEKSCSQQSCQLSLIPPSACFMMHSRHKTTEDESKSQSSKINLVEGALNFGFAYCYSYINCATKTA